MKSKNKYVVNYTKKGDLETVYVCEIMAYSENQAQFMFAYRNRAIDYNVLNVEIFEDFFKFYKGGNLYGGKKTQGENVSALQKQSGV